MTILEAWTKAKEGQEIKRKEHSWKLIKRRGFIRAIVGEEQGNAGEWLFEHHIFALDWNVVPDICPTCGQELKEKK